MIAGIADRPTDCVSIPEAARLVGVHPKSVGRWIRKGYVQGWHKGELVQVSASEVKAWALRRYEPPDEDEEQAPPRTPQEDVRAAEAAKRRMGARGW
jgi:excisionase family DNA binding protein